MMTTIILAVAVVVANGFGRRLSGGLLQQWVGGPIGGTQVGRLVQAAIAGASVAVLAWHAGQALPLIWWVPLAAAAAVFVGATWGFPRYSLRWPFLNLRASHMVPESVGDTVGLSINGIAACAPLAVLAWSLGLDWWWMVAAGVARGPAYWLAAAALPPWHWMGFRWFAPDQQRDIPMPTALAEFYAGAALGLALVLLSL